MGYCCVVPFHFEIGLAMADMVNMYGMHDSIEKQTDLFQRGHAIFPASVRHLLAKLVVVGASLRRTANVSVLHQGDWTKQGPTGRTGGAGSRNHDHTCVVMVKPGGTARPMLAISAQLAPLPPSRCFMDALPSEPFLSNEYTRCVVIFCMPNH